MCTPHDFLSSKVNLCIRALSLDHILALKKITRTPRVHLVLYMASLSRARQTVRTSPSSVEITLERGSNRSTKPINLKIGLDMEN